MSHRSWTTAFVLLFISVMLMIPARQAIAQRGGPDHRFREHTRLNLSPEQRNKLHKHIREMRDKMSQTGRQLGETRGALREQYAQYNLDNRRVNSLISRINDLQLRLLNINLENQKALRGILTEDQLNELHTAIGERRPFDREPEIGIGGDNPGNIERLGMTSKQQEQIKKLYKSSQENSQSLREKLRTEAQGLHQLYNNYKLDPKQAKARIDKLNNCQLGLLKAMASRQTELRKILTEDQFNTLEKSIRPHEGRRPGFRRPSNRGQGLGDRG